jgi:hypothetical protein
MIAITETVALKVRDTVRAGLVAGVGDPEPGKMCVEAAVCFALGLPHGDEPICVSPALRRFKIPLNDAPWSSTQARAKGLERLALAQLGSNVNFNDLAFVKRLAAAAGKWSAAAAAGKWSAAAAEAAAAAAAGKWSATDAAAAAAAAGKWSAAAAAAYDTKLSEIAEDVVKILIDMKAPGCQWLYLTERGQ